MIDEENTMKLEWENVSVKLGEKALLSNVSGTCEPGELLAVMGSTGAGKTTLLSTLAHRFQNVLNYQGKVRYGGLKYSSSLRRYIAVVGQDDIVIPTLTVREHVSLCARLRLPAEEVDEQVNMLISALRLQKCENNKIGDIAMRGISGGERKRTCIAVELLTNPLILFLDEATTGLDSATSKIMVSLVKKIASEKKISVFATIHQPSSQLFFLFDKLLVLHNGFTVFNGPTTRLVTWFSDAGFPIPEHFNPADFLLDLLVDGEYDSKKDQFDEAKRKLEQSMVIHDGDAPTSPEKSLDNQGGAKSFRGMGRDGVLQLRVSDRFAVPWWVQYKVLLFRMRKIYYSNFFTRDSVVVNIGLIIMGFLLFFLLPQNSDYIYSRVALCFWLCGTWMYFSLLGGLFVFHDDFNILKKDLEDGSYRMSAYFLAKNTVLFFSNLFWPIAYLIFVLNLTNLVPTFTSGLLVFLSVLLIAVTFQSIAYIISISVGAGEVMTAGILCATFLFGFAGFLSPPQSLPFWLQWTQWANVMTWALQLLFQLTFQEDFQYPCVSGSPSTFMVCDNGNNASGIVTQADIFQIYQVDRSIGACVGFMFGMIVVLRLCTFLQFSRTWKSRLAKSKQMIETDEESSSLPLKVKEEEEEEGKDKNEVVV